MNYKKTIILTISLLIFLNISTTVNAKYYNENSVTKLFLTSETNSPVSYFELGVVTIVLIILAALIIYNKRHTTNNKQTKKDYYIDPEKTTISTLNLNKTKDTTPIFSIKPRETNNVITTSEENSSHNQIGDLVDNLINNTNNATIKPGIQIINKRITFSTFNNTAQQQDIAEEPINPKNKEIGLEDEITNDQMEDILNQIIEDAEKQPANIMRLEPDKTSKKYRIPRIRRRT